MRKVGGMSGVCFLAVIGTLYGITLADSSIFSGFLGKGVHMYAADA